MWGTRTILPKLPFSCYATVGRLNSIRLALRYNDLLEFWFVERTVQFITVPIDQTIHWWVGSVRNNNRKQFFCPVRHVPLFEVSFRFAYAHSIASSELRCADAFVAIQSLPHGFLIGTGHFWRSHTDTAVMCVVVRSHKSLKDADVSNRLGFREITPHTCLQCPIEPLDNARLRFFVVRRKMMHTVLF